MWLYCITSFCLNTENLFFFFVKMTVLIKIPLFWLVFLKIPLQTQENVFPNFFSKVATESELVGPTIAL